MVTVIFGAMRARTAQSLTVLILAALPATAAAAAPWYGLAAGTSAAAAEVTAAPAAERVVNTSSPATGSAGPQATLDTFGTSMRTLLPIPGATAVLGLRRPMLLSGGPQSGAALDVAYRDGFCDQVRLTGTCPVAAGEAAVSRDLTRRIPLAAGDSFQVKASSTAPPRTYRVTGVYEPLDPAGAYWSDPLFTANGKIDPFFTPIASFRDPQLSRPVLSYDVEIPAALLRGDDGYDVDRAVEDAAPALSAAQVTAVYQLRPLKDRIAAARAAILRGLLIVLAQLLVLGWFALALAGRYTSRDRRGDAGLLKLRGSTRAEILRLGLGQHFVPLLGGVLAGLPAGLLCGWLLAGRLPVAAEIPAALVFSVVAVLAVLLGGLLVLALIDAAALRLPVAALLRRVPARRRGWRSDVVDVALIAVAAFAVYQARTGGPENGLAVAAPALVALAVALVLARLLRLIADRAGAGAVRRGRLRFGLTAVQVSRQPGTDRVFALIVVAVAMFAVATGTFTAGQADRAARSATELGAARVLTVAAPTRTRLEYAVRTADPAGRYAMAAVVDATSNPPVLVVDSTRLAAVATWRPEYGPVTALAEATAAARLPAALPLVTGTGLTLRVHSDRAGEGSISAFLQHEGSGRIVEAQFRGIRRGDQQVSTPVNGCAEAPGCRLVRWQLFTPPGADGSPEPGAITVQGLTQRGPDAEILTAAQLADPARWHTDFTGVALKVSATGSGLAMAAATRSGLVSGDKTFVMDAPLPLPVVLAGAAPTEWRFTDAASYRFGPNETPVRVAGTARVLPVLGGAGMMADLDATRRIAADAELGGTFQVWLSADAPPSIVDALTAAGLTVTGDDTLAARTDRLAQQGSIVAARFGLLTVGIALLLAAAMLAVTAAVDREPQLAQLRALRTQGLPRPAAVAAGYAGPAGLAAAGVAGGLLAALIAGPVAAVTAPPFADGWRVLPPGDPLTLGTLLLALVAAVIVLGTAGWLSVRPLVHRLRAR